MTSAPFFQALTLLVTLFAATLFDSRRQSVPNQVLLAGGALLLILRFLEGVLPALYSLLFASLMLLICLPVYRLGMAGAADLKMIVLMIACCPDGRFLKMLFFSLLAAGIGALFRLLQAGCWRVRLQHMLWYISARKSGACPRYYDRERDGVKAVMPMAGFFLFGAVLGLAL